MVSTIVLYMIEHYKLPLAIAYFNDIVVGGVCCRVETEAMVKKLYIMTLGCLAAYRRLGVGTYLYTLSMCVLGLHLHVPIKYQLVLYFFAVVEH